MSISLRGKSILKKIALVLAGVTAITAAGFGVKAIVDKTNEDLKTITPSFEVGNLGSDGKFVDDKSTLYTKDAFACYGLQVKPDFDSSVNYQIFYYDILDNYISSTSSLSDGYSGEAPVNGAYARMVIEPRDDEDGKISLTERVKYPGQLTVKVKKEQNLNERFTSFKGRLMQVVNDVGDLSFVKNLEIDLTTLNWKEASNTSAVTSTCVLKVQGDSTVSFDFSKFASATSNNDPFSLRIFEFSELPLDNFYIKFDYVDSSKASSVVLNYKTRYIIINVVSMDGPFNWSETMLKDLPSCFTITKSK